MDNEFDALWNLLIPSDIIARQLPGKLYLFGTDVLVYHYRDRLRSLPGLPLFMRRFLPFGIKYDISHTIYFVYFLFIVLSIHFLPPDIGLWQRFVIVASTSFLIAAAIIILVDRRYLNGAGAMSASTFLEELTRYWKQGDRIFFCQARFTCRH